MLKKNSTEDYKLFLIEYKYGWLPEEGVKYFMYMASGSLPSTRHPNSPLFEIVENTEPTVAQDLYIC